MKYKPGILFGIYFLLLTAPGVVVAQAVDSGVGKKQPSPVVADGAVPKLVAKQFSFTEGPTADKKGDVYFTDQPNDKIWKYDTEGKLTVFMDKTGRSNGMYFDKKGRLISCADERNE